MKNPASIATFDELLAHADWVRALARSLVKDESRVDDVVQQTLLTALEHAPAKVRSWRAWITTVLRNVVRRDERTEKRRTHRERLAYQEGRVPTPEQIADREQVRRQVITIVLGLSEPYRSTLLLRFYEDLAPIEIARHLLIPDGTVRVRLKRGLAQVREQLEKTSRRDFGDERQALLLLLGPLDKVIPPPLPHCLPADPSASPGSGATPASSVVIHAGVLAGVVVLAGIGFLALWSQQKGGDAAAIARDETSDRVPVFTVDSSPLAVREVASLSDHSSRAPYVPRVSRAPATLFGVVLDQSSHLPVAGVEITATPETGPVAAGAPIGEDRSAAVLSATSDSSGRFAFHHLLEGPYRLELCGGEEEAIHSAALRDGAFVQLWSSVSSDPSAGRGSLSVRVEGKSGQPIAGASVELYCRDRRVTLSTLPICAVTDTNGVATLPVKDLLRGVLIAREFSVSPGQPRASPRVARLDFATDEDLQAGLQWVKRGPAYRPVIRMQLGGAGVIAGRLEGGAGVVKAYACSYEKTFGAAVRAEFSATAREDGMFEILDLPVGRYLIDVVAADSSRRLKVGARPTAEGLEYKPIEVLVEPLRTTRVDLQLNAGARVAGRVVDEMGRPLPGAVVRALLPQGPRNFPLRQRRAGTLLWRLDEPVGFEEWCPMVAGSTCTDGSGRYELSGLLPGEEWTLEVLAPGLTFDRRESLHLEPERPLELEHVLREAGVIQGVGWEKGSIAIRRTGEEIPRVALLLPRESLAPFTVTGLEPGTYEILEVGRNEQAVELVQSLTSVEVRAGELTFVDLRPFSSDVLHSRISFKGAPVAHAVLNFEEGQTVSDDSGAFRFQGSRSPSVWLDLSAPAIEGGVTLRLSFASADLPQELELPEGELSVTLLCPEGRPAAGRVCLRPRLPAEDITAWKQVWQSKSPRDLCKVLATQVSAGSSGTCTLRCLPAGEYVVAAVLENGFPIAPRIVTIAARGRSLVELQAKERAAALQVSVRSADGSPLAGFWVELRLHQDGVISPGLLESRTDDNGVVVFDPLPEGRFEVVTGRRWTRTRPSAVGYPTPIPSAAGFPDGLSQFWKERALAEQRPGPFVLRSQTRRISVDLSPGERNDVLIEF